MITLLSITLSVLVGCRSLEVALSPGVDTIVSPDFGTIVYQTGVLMQLFCLADSSRVEFVWTDPNGTSHTRYDSLQRPRVQVEEVVPSLSQLTILRLRDQDSGTWACTARSSDGTSARRETRLELYRPISFRGTTQLQEALTGSDFLLRCMVSGSPVPTISFRRDGQLMTSDNHYDQTDRGLEIHNVQESDAGTYQCRAEQEIMGVISMVEIELQVFSAVEGIRFRGTSRVQGAFAGGSFLLKCEASGKPTPVISFRHDGERITSDDHYQIVDRGLEITDVQESDAGTYQCRAEQEMTGVLESIDIELQVFSEVERITFQNTPNIQEALEGTDFVLGCHATGTPPPTVSFRRDGVQITLDDHYQLLDRGLMIHNVQESDAGTYQCVAQQEMLDVFSLKNIELQVFSAIESVSFQGTSRVQGALEGANFLLKCEASGKPTPVISFRHDGERITSDDHYQIVDRGLEITDVQESDAGTYQCRAEQEITGVLESIDIELEVFSEVERITFQNTPNIQEALEGTDFVLECHATGTPPPIVSFRRDGVQLTPDDHYQETNRGLQIRNVQTSDADVYQCLAEQEMIGVFASVYIELDVVSHTGD